MSYATGADVTWLSDDDDVVELLGRDGKHRRIRVSVTKGRAWEVSVFFGRPAPTLFADGWWTFVRVDPSGHREAELYLAPENAVRELVFRIADGPAAQDDVAAQDTVRILDADLRPLLGSWAELCVE